MTDERSGYVLVTAAYNESALIEKTLRSVVEQSIKPIRWVIVSDGSTDATDQIVERYHSKYAFIELVRVTEHHPRNFAAQVHAINLGIARLAEVPYAFLGNIDADVVVPQQYFEDLLRCFAEDSKLGLCGGYIYEWTKEQFEPRAMNSPRSVAHACQFFRRDCFEAIGARYLALPYGGPDTYAEVSARMLGWGVRALRSLPVLHLRPTASAGGVLRGAFRQGRMDYSLGALPGFEVFKVLRRLRAKPYVLGAVSRMAGFLYSCCRRERRPVSPEFVRFLRGEQKNRLHALWKIKTHSLPLENA